MIVKMRPQWGAASRRPALCPGALRSSNTLPVVTMVSSDGPPATAGLGQLRGASMRLPTLSLLLISAVLFGEMHAASAQSPTSYPWCSRSGDGDSYNICYFTSKEQCQGTTFGVAAFCFANPYYRPSPQASDEAVSALRRPGGERYQPSGEPNRRVGSLQSRVVRAKPSTSTGERSPAGRIDAAAAEAQMPQQETQSLADVIAAGVARVVSAIPETAANMGIDLPRP